MTPRSTLDFEPSVLPAAPSPNGRVERARISSPMLIVLAGSTAAYAGLEFMRQARELPESDRRRVALVSVDIDKPYPDVVAFRAEHARLFTEKIVRIGVPPNVRFITRIDQGGRAGEPHTYLEGKMPDPHGNGAGGIRNNGHVAFCHHVAEITTNLNEAITQITSREVYRDLPVPEEVRVAVVAFIGGGTASGIAADLVCLVRQLLDTRNLKPRVTLTCILPANLQSHDLELRRSNAVACLLEVLALSQASGPDGGPYRKYLRARYHDLPAGPIAHETYLIGSANMTDIRRIARIAGMDLFQKTLDESGTGALESSEAVDRNCLALHDDRDLPTMFGTSCPLEARFPTRETARAFAEMAASHVMPLLIGYVPPAVESTPEEEQGWRKDWDQVVSVDAGDRAVQIPHVSHDRYVDLDETALDPLWSDVAQAAATITRQIEKLVTEERAKQYDRIADRAGLPEERMRQWQQRLREYQVALDALPRTARPERPVDLERRALGRFGRRAGEDRLYRAHDDYLHQHARHERRRQLGELLGDLLAQVNERLQFLSEIAAGSDAARAAVTLERHAQASAAWQGRLEDAHPFQLHAFDVDLLGRTSGAHPAVRRLYEQATAAIGGGATEGGLDYRRFVGDVAGHADVERLHRSGDRLAETVVAFFYPRYLEELRKANLLELLARVVPDERNGASAERPVDRALTQLLDRLMSLKTELVPFDAHIGGAESMDALRTEVFLGCQVRDKADEDRVREIATRAGILSPGVDRFRPSLDPHRLQVLYQHHGISLGTISDYFSPVNSAMEAYLRLEERWIRSPAAGGLPPHGCTALREMVLQQEVVERLLRSGDGGSASRPNGPVGGGPILS